MSNTVLTILFSMFNITMLELLSYFFLHQIFKQRASTLQSKILLVCFIPAIVSIDFLTNSNFISGLTQLFFVFLLGYICFESSLSSLILFLVIQQFIYITGAALGSSIIIFTGSKHLIEKLTTENVSIYHFVNSTIAYILIFCATNLICHLWKKSSQKTPLSQKILLSISGIINIICLLLNVRMVSQVGLKTLDGYLSCILPAALFFFYIAFFFYSDKYYKMKDLATKEHLARIYARKDQTYYSNLEQQQKEIRKLHHDMKNHLLVLQNMTKAQGKNNYIDDLLGQLEQSQTYIDTHNGIADIIFYEKQKEAKKHDITIRFQVEENILQQINEVHLCSILTNAIDNGIEACQSLEKDKQLIVKVVQTPPGIILTFENEFASPLQKEQDHYLTTKSDHENHGLGLQNIKTAVNELNGSMNIDTSNNHFLLSILLPFQHFRTNK